MHGVHVQGLDGRKDAGRHALRGDVRRIVAQDKILNILLRPAGVRRHAASGLRHPVAEEHEHISHVKMQVALVQLLFLNKVDGIVIFCDRTVMHKYGVRVIILDQARAGSGRLQDRESRIGKLSFPAHGQRLRHGRNALVNGHAALEHGREHGRCQRGENVGLDAAAEAVGEDDRRIVSVPFERALISAERLPVFVAADDADVPDRVPAAIDSFTHHRRRPHRA